MEIKTTRHKNKQRITRAKAIGEDYTEYRLKERLTEILQTNHSEIKEESEQ